MSGNEVTTQTRKVVTWGHPALTARCRPANMTPAARPLRERDADDLLAVVAALDGQAVGLAANQIALRHAACVIAAPGKDPYVMFNPKITERSGEDVATEGCLSLPGKAFTVPRATRVHVHSWTIEGAEYEFDAEGYEARIIQHEVDHLNGKLIIDRCPPGERKRMYR